MRTLALASVFALAASAAADDARAERPTIAAVDVQPDQVRLLVLLRSGDLRPEDFRLIVDEGRRGSVMVAATPGERATLPRFGEAAGEKTAVVLVVQTTEAFLGAGGCGDEDQAVLDHDQRSAALGRALTILARDRADLGVVTFASGVIGVRWLGANRTPLDAIGENKGFCGHRGGHLVEPLQAARRLLNEHPASRRAIVVVAASGAGPEALTVSEDDEAALRDARIELYSLIVDAGGRRLPLGEFFPVRAMASLPEEAGRVVRYLDAAHWVSFSRRTMPRDGRDHRLALEVRGSEDTIDAPQSIVLSAVGGRRSPWSRVLMVAGCVVVGVVLLVLFLGLRRKRSGERGARVVDRPRTEILPEVTPAAPRKTIALEPRKTEIVVGYTGPKGVAGWVVTLNGARPYQTFVLDRSGDTVIGADAAAGIVLVDGKVSGRHCKIVGREGTFAIVDTSSRNGVFVDGERVDELTLRSGMEIKVGDTLLIFKAVSPDAAVSAA